jgi:serine-type D-Ala-D-Ala carboxypeptidase
VRGAALDALLAEGVARGDFPLARACVLHQGQRVYEGGNAPAALPFDLASLTKVLATTPLVLSALRRTHLRPSTPVSEVLPGAAPALTFEDCLKHRAGLPAWHPYFAEVLPGLMSHEPTAQARAEAAGLVRRRVLATAPTSPPGQKAVYSDVGFLLLGFAVEALQGAPLDEAFAREVAGPAGVAVHFRRRASPQPPAAPTGATRPREPAPGQEGLWTLPEVPWLAGDVDDDNAFALDGVAGHAGLFGTAADGAALGQAVLEGRLAEPPTPFGPDATVPGSTRTWGFDTPGDEAPSCGRRFGRAGPWGAVGHTGFTGTSLWVDLDRSLVVALLTNRVALGRANLGIRGFRPRFHDAVLDAL